MENFRRVWAPPQRSAVRDWTNIPCKGKKERGKKGENRTTFSRLPRAVCRRTAEIPRRTGPVGGFGVSQKRRGRVFYN